MILEQPAHKGHRPTQAALGQINQFLKQYNSEELKVLSWLVRWAKENNASGIHLDWLNSSYIISLRVAGELGCFGKLSFEQGTELINIIKQELHIGSINLQKPWSGRLPTMSHENHQHNEIHIVPFQPLESIIIRLRPQPQANPSWTDTIGIRKKIFIWQMGKVGSSTVLASLKPHTVKYDWRFETKISDEPYWQYNNIIHSHSAKPIYHMLHHSNEEFIIISLVRDLLQRNISAVFQSMCDKTPGNLLFIAPEKELRKWSYEQIQEKILDKLLLLNLSDRLTKWYDNLFKSHIFYPDIDRYHIDIYSTPFNKKKGLQVYKSKTPRIKLMIIRLENLNELAEEIGIFLGIEKFCLCQDNIATHKWYNELYNQFKASYMPTRRELEHIYNSRFMNYFYSTRFR